MPLSSVTVAALRRKCESLDPGETVLSLCKETALAMLDEFDVGQREQARLSRENEKLVVELAAAEERVEEAKKTEACLIIARSIITELAFHADPYAIGSKTAEAFDRAREFLADPPPTVPANLRKKTT